MELHGKFIIYNEPLRRALLHAFTIPARNSGIRVYDHYQALAALLGKARLIQPKTALRQTNKSRRATPTCNQERTQRHNSQPRTQPRIKRNHTKRNNTVRNYAGVCPIS